MKIQVLELTERSLRIIWGAPFLCLLGFLVKLNISTGRLFGEDAVFSDLSSAMTLSGICLVSLFLAILWTLAGASVITCAGLAAGNMPFRLTDGLRGAGRSFARLLSLNVLAFPIFLPAAMIAAIIIRAPRGGYLVATVPVGACLLVFFFAVGVMFRLAKRECVLGGKSPIPALKGGAGMFFANPRRMFVVWLMENLLGGLFVLSLIALGVILTLILTVSFGVIGMKVPLALTSIGGLLMVFVAVGIAGAFSQTYWTLAYLKLNGGPGDPHQSDAP